MLSAYSSLTSKHVTSEKLSPNLYDQTNYVVHYENLRFYLKHRLQLIKVHRILKFKQCGWIKPLIDFNTAKRRGAKSPEIGNPWGPDQQATGVDEHDSERL